MKEVKRSLGRALKVLRGNMEMRLEMMLEMPTASESSISILATRNWAEGELDRSDCRLVGKKKSRNGILKGASTT